MKAGLGFAIVVLLACTVWAQGPPQQAPPGAPAAPAPATPSQRAAREIPARLLDFEAEPASIRPGQTGTRLWHTENPLGVTIDPDPGRVMPRGSRQLKADPTTKDTLPVRGQNKQGLTK